MTLTPVAWHTLFELAAYAVGFRVFLRARRALALPALAGDRAAWLAGAAIIGAAVGAKLSFWLEDPGFAFEYFPDWHRLLAGKSIVGALLGGLLAVEGAKHALGIRESSGDAFVPALVIGIAIGRIGCFVAGLDDRTYGLPTPLPWGVDFGDGIARHPTQLYEIAFVLALGWALHAARARFAVPGARFRAFMLAYLAFRFAIEFIKPMPHVYFGALSGIQLLCLAGFVHYHRDIARLWRGAAWARR